jgi:ABC-type branched-subunit amino acid transport system substrate-binding protein
MMNRTHRVRAGLCALALASITFAVDADVVIGMSNALTGPASGLGTGMKTGSTAYFQKINGAGGVNGHKINMISYDDGYEPDRAAAMTEKLVNEDKVAALFGFVGTPTAKAAVPAAQKGGVPFFAPFTGAEFLRNPVNPVVFNIRASYFDETEGLVDHFITDLGLKKIGIFIQDDAYGEAGKGGVNKALHKRSLPLVGEGRYKRNTEDVAAGLAALKAANPEVVIMVGAYKACAAFVKAARAAGFNPKFANVSFVGTDDFIREAGKDGEGVYISQVVPSPKDASIGVVKQYQTDMKAAGNSDFGYTSLEGYIAAVTFVEALKKAGGAPSRESIANAVNALDLDLGGFKVKFAPNDHQGSKQVYFTQVRGGTAAPISKF